MATPKNNSVIKAFDILQLLARNSRPLSVQQIARETGATLSTAHRFLLTLEEIGAVTRQSGNLYHLGMLISELGQSAGREQILTELAKVHIEALSEELGETVSLTLFNKGGLQKVAWHVPKRPLVCRERSDFGPSFHNTSIGKLYLSILSPIVREERLSNLRLDKITDYSVASLEALREQIRETSNRNYSLCLQESELGLADISLPIISDKDEVIGALTVSAPVTRLESPKRENIIARVRETIQAIVSRVFIKSYTLPGKAQPRGSFPHVKRVENLVFISGTSSRRPNDSFAGITVFPDGSLFHNVFEQTRETMQNVSDILGTLSLNLSDIVNLEAFLINAEEEHLFYSAINQAFSGPLPAITVTAAKALPHPHQAIMVKAVASYNALEHATTQ